MTQGTLEECQSSASQPGKGGEIRREFVEVVKMVLLFLVLFVVLRTFVIEGYEVQGDSMAPTLEEGERILVFKLPHTLSQLPFCERFSGLRESDIVVFNSHDLSHKRYIKRIIAEGPGGGGGNLVSAGEHDGTKASSRQVKVEFDRGRVFVDNHLVDESYLVAEERFAPRRATPVYLDRGEYYVLGDHRSVSKDSRSFGPINKEQLIGEAVLRFWPLNKMGLL